MKKKLFAVILIIAFAYLLAMIFYMFNVTKNYTKLKDKVIENNVSFQMEKMNKNIAFIEDKCGDVAAIGTSAYLFNNSALPREFLKATLGKLKHVVGMGLYYEPYAFDKNKKRFGYFAYNSNGKILEADTTNTTKKYDYLNESWYQYSKNEFEKGKNEVWTPIYEDEFYGKKYWVIAFTSASRDKNGKLIGMSGVEWYLVEILKTLNKLKPTPRSVVILGSPEYDYAITNFLDKENPNIQKWSEIVSPDKIKPPKDKIIIDKKVNINGKEYISFATTFNNDLSLVVRVPRDEIYATMERNNFIISILFIILTILGSILTWLFVSKQFIKPLLILNKKSQLIGQGKLDEKINIKNKDEIGQLANSFNTMTENLKEYIKKSAAKSIFMANMSHEIRTPLNSIFGFLELLKSTKLNIEQADYLNEVQQSSEILFKILNDILDFSKAEAGKIELEHINFDLKKLLKNIAVITESNAKSKNIDIITDIDENIPQNLLGDSLRLRQVLTNLTSNALKFTEKGQIKITAKIFKKNTDNSLTIYFQVTDTGIGIPIDKQSKIFEEFSQADESTTRQYGGTGLGLAICKKIVTLMGGRLMIKSQEGKGSTFYFSVNFDIDDNPDINEENIILDKKINNKNAKILIAEDNPINQKLIIKFLEKLEMKATIVNNGKECYETYKNDSFDLILMDCQMPVMDGYEATKQIREFEKQQNIEHVTIIALTANAFNSNKTKCLDTGMDDYLAKPIKYIELVQKLNEHLKQNIDTSITTENEVFEINNELDIENTIKKMENDLGFDRETINTLLNDFFAQLKNDLNNLQNAIDNNDFTQVNQIGHSLKGAAGSLCLDNLAELFEQVEIKGKTQNLDNIHSILTELFDISNKY